MSTPSVRSVSISLGVLALVALLGVTAQTFTDSTPALAGPDGDDEAKASPAERGAALWMKQCAACHGMKGEADGLVTAHLDPVPRDFSMGRFRLVSTAKLQPTDADLRDTIGHGMPGSSMPAFGHLGRKDLDALVAHVRKLTREGMIERFVALENPSGETMSMDEAIELTDERLAVGEKLPVPEATRASQTAILRGRRLFVESCSGCHGAEGRGDGVRAQLTDEGHPVKPRDLTRGIFKGDDSPKALFRRIRLGMPGSRMPRYTKEAGFTDIDVWDLVHYVRTLYPENARARHSRRGHSLDAPRVESDDLPSKPDDVMWSVIPAARVNVTPLRWRDDATEAVLVQAAHDGKTMAVKLTWEDPTRDDEARLFDAFPDGVAIQLSADDDPPFIAMGAGGASPVSIWHWLASADGFFERRATEHMAAGPHTRTERPTGEQNVIGVARWKKRFWEVVFQRPLAAAPLRDCCLAPGDDVAFAIAVWDGSSGDFNERKSVSVWHRLKIAPMGEEAKTPPQ